MSAPGGLERLIATAGTPTKRIFGEPAEVDLDALRAAAAEVDVALA